MGSGWISAGNIFGEIRRYFCCLRLKIWQVSVASNQSWRTLNTAVVFFDASGLWVGQKIPHEKSSTYSPTDSKKHPCHAGPNRLNSLHSPKDLECGLLTLSSTALELDVPSYEPRFLSRLLLAATIGIGVSAQGQVRADEGPASTPAKPDM